MLSYSAVHHLFLFFFFNDTATTEIYTLSLHDALPILHPVQALRRPGDPALARDGAEDAQRRQVHPSPPEKIPIFFIQIGRHTSELQSRQYLVCRLLLEKKKKMTPSQFV